jgi:hypothetical protein
MKQSVTTLAITFLLSCAYAPMASADCPDSNPAGERRVPLQDELKDSVAVIVGKVVGRRELHETVSDPKLVTAVLFRVQVVQLVQGNIPAEIDIRKEPRSGRAALETGREYLLIVQRRGPRWPLPLGDAYYVSDCGNSGPLAERSDVLRELTAGAAIDPQAQLGKAIQAWSGSAVLVHFRYVLLDLNDDGIADALALMTAPEYCASGGCELVVLKGSPDGSFRAISASTMTREPISVLGEKNHGWHTMVVSHAGGTVSPCRVRLQFNGLNYPANPALAPCATEGDLRAASPLTFVP